MEQIFWLVQAMGMLQEAIACYQRALQARPDYAMAYGTVLLYPLCARTYGRFGLCPTTIMLIVGNSAWLTFLVHRPNEYQSFWN